MPPKMVKCSGALRLSLRFMSDMVIRSYENKRYVLTEQPSVASNAASLNQWPMPSRSALMTISLGVSGYLRK